METEACPERAGEALHRAVRALAWSARAMERAIAPLTLSQYRVLGLVAGAPERASRLAAGADVTKATLTGTLDGLEGHGWVARAQVEGDRRGVSLTVTEQGRAVLAAADAQMARWLADVLGRVEPAAADGLIEALDRLGSALQADRDHRHAMRP